MELYYELKKIKRWFYVKKFCTWRCRKVFLSFFLSFFLIFQLTWKLYKSGNLFKMNAQIHKAGSLKVYSCTQRQKESNFQTKAIFKMLCSHCFRQMSSMPTWPSIRFFISSFWWKLVGQMIFGHPPWKWIQLQTYFSGKYHLSSNVTWT